MFSLALAARYELLPSSTFLRNLQFASSDEENYVRQIFSRARSKKIKIHVLKNDDSPYGFVALAIANFNDVPSIIIEYLFTSEPYRKQTYPELGETPLKISEFLIGKTIEMAEDITNKVPLRYIALQLAAERLEALYEPYGFRRTEGTNWMSQTISVRKFI
jgi:hypothetical protein